MADDYGDLVELGFEGIDRITEKFHDPVADFALKHTPKLSPLNKKKANNGATRPDRSQREAPKETRPNQPKMNPEYPRDQHLRDQHPRDQYPSHPPDPYRASQYAPVASDRWSEQTRYYQDLPPPPSASSPRVPSPPQQRARRRPDRHDEYDDTEPESDGDYYGHSRGERGRRDGSYSDYGHQGVRGDQPMKQRGSPPAAGRAMESRGRPQAPRRGSSWSPPRRSGGKSSEKRRGNDGGASSSYLARSNSPNAKYRAAAAIAGAFAGGIAGSRVQRDQPVANSVSTVLGAIVGGLGAREAEQAWTERRRQRRRAQAEQERG